MQTRAAGVEQTKKLHFSELVFELFSSNENTKQYNSKGRSHKMSRINPRVHGVRGSRVEDRLLTRTLRSTMQAHMHHAITCVRSQGLRTRTTHAQAPCYQPYHRTCTVQSYLHGVRGENAYEESSPWEHHLPRGQRYTTAAILYSHAPCRQVHSQAVAIKNKSHRQVKVVTRASTRGVDNCLP